MARAFALQSMIGLNCWALWGLVGSSTGNYDAATTADFTSDAEAAVTWLETQPEIDPRRVGLLGHSEGGVIAPAVAVEDKSVAFVVMIAGPALRGDQLFILQSAMTARTYGAPDDYIARRKVFDAALYQAILSAPSDREALDRAKILVARGVADRVIDANEAETLAQDVTRPWERYFLAYDPAPTLAALRFPFWRSTDRSTCRCRPRRILLPHAKL